MESKQANVTDSTIEQIKNYKSIGNDHYKKGELVKALRNYYNAELYFRSIDPRGTRADDLSEMLLKPKGKAISEDQQDE